MRMWCNSTLVKCGDSAFANQWLAKGQDMQWRVIQQDSVALPCSLSGFINNKGCSLLFLELQPLEA
eukprot:3379342-Amphidinium_carterae.1